MLLNRLSLLFALACAGAGLAHSQTIDFTATPATWQQHLDQQTTGAAASAVLYSRCATDANMQTAHNRIGVRLRLAIAALSADFGADEAETSGYASEAYRTKVAALWQSTAGAPCSSHTRLFDLSRAFGYPAERFK